MPLFIFDYTGAEACGWKLYDTSDEEFYFYDAENIVESKGAIKVSEKSVVRRIKRCNLTEALKEIRESENKSSGRTAESSEKAVKDMALQETRRLYEIRCSKKTYRIVTGMEYDKEGTLIAGIVSSKWQTIKLNSFIEKLYKAVCD